jgi:hypothetical protein
MSNPILKNESKVEANSVDASAGELAQTSGPLIDRESEKKAVAIEAVPFEYVLGNVTLSGISRGNEVEEILVAGEDRNGRPRIAYSNETDRGTNFIPGRIATELYEILSAIGKDTRPPAEILRAIGDSLEEGAMVGFFRPTLPYAVFQLPDGLRSTKSVGVLPLFEQFYRDPSLATDLFVVTSSMGRAAVLFRESEGFALVSANDQTYRVPTNAAEGDIRAFITAKLNMFVDDQVVEFEEAMRPFEVSSTWSQAGGPTFFVVSEGRYGFGASPF